MIVQIARAIVRASVSENQLSNISLIWFSVIVEFSHRLDVGSIAMLLL